MRGEKFSISCCVLGFLLVILSCHSVNSSELRVGFYRFSCPPAEAIVREEVKREFFFRDKGVAPGLVRMHFHDCFVRGCDGSVLIDSTASNRAEKDSPANNPSLRGFEVIDRAKARIESQCEGIVSCADILAFAARDSIILTKGLGYNVPAGRRDGSVSIEAETFTNWPPPTFNVNQLTLSFNSKGFTQAEMVTLSGAHTIGRSHCSSFSNRLYNFNGSSGQDPSFDPIYAAQLKRLCPQGRLNLVVPMEPVTPTIMDVNYYIDILKNRGLFTSDQTLMSNIATANEVSRNARNQILWLKKFAAAMIKMGELDVITGRDCEIRRNCRVINRG